MALLQQGVFATNSGVKKLGATRYTDKPHWTPKLIAWTKKMPRLRQTRGRRVRDFKMRFLVRFNWRKNAPTYEVVRATKYSRTRVNPIAIKSFRRFSSCKKGMVALGLTQKSAHEQCALIGDGSNFGILSQLGLIPHIF